MHWHARIGPALAAIAAFSGLHSPASATQAEVRPLPALRIVTNASTEDAAYAAITELAAGARALLGAEVGIRTLRSGREALSALKDTADVAVVKMPDLGDRPLFRYAEQPYISRDLETARRLDRRMRRDLEKAVQTDLGAALLGTVPGSPKVVLSPMGNWDGSFSGSAVLARTGAEVLDLARIGILNATDAPTAEIGRRLQTMGRALAIVPLDEAISLAREYPRLRLYDQRVSFPILAVLAGEARLARMETSQREALRMLAKAVEDGSWSRLEERAQQAFERASASIGLGTLSPGGAFNRSKLLLSSVAANAAGSVGETVQAHAQHLQQAIVQDKDQQTYGLKCRNLEILVVTNRAGEPPLGTTRPLVLNERGDELRGKADSLTHYGVIKVHVSGHGWNPSATLSDCVDWKGRSITDRGFELLEVRLLSAADFRRRAGASPPGFTKDSPFVVFVHGYRTTFRDAVQTVAALSVKLRHQRRAVLVTWPSTGELLDYDEDGKRAAASTHLVPDAIRALRGANPVGNIDVVAHSMGNRVALAGLDGIATAADPSTALGLRELVNVAPDVQCERYVGLLGSIQKTRANGSPLFQRATLYLYENDFALRWSERYRVFHPERERCRMGNQRGPAAAYIPALEAVDWSCLKERDIVDSHSYYVLNDYIARDLRDAIAGGKKPIERDLERIDVAPNGRYFLHPAAVLSKCAPAYPVTDPQP